MRIIGYAPEHQPAFKRINVAWIAERFQVEAVDLDVLDDPAGNILAPGGHILLAEEGGAIVGTCALLRASGSTFQMAKMAVDRPHRGKGIGRMLCQAAVEKARALGASKVFLYSNTQGSAEAITLYRRLGFIERPLPTQAYARADIYMELDLGSAD